LRQVVILAGGKGTRLKPYTTTFPKPLVPIGDYPILEVIIRQLAHFGFTDIKISTGHLAALIEAYFAKGERWGVDIEYLREEMPLNTAGALKQLRDSDEHFLVINGDVLSNLNYRKLFDAHVEKGVQATIAVTAREPVIDYGVIQKDDQGFLENYLEKPIYRFHVSMGIYVLSRECLNFIESGEAIGMPDLFMRIKRSGGSIFCYPGNCYWMDIGRIDDYEKAQQDFEANRESFLINESQEDTHYG
jgi:NDP-sugar pyrophosphorylase family protein